MAIEVIMLFRTVNRVTQPKDLLDQVGDFGGVRDSGRHWPIRLVPFGRLAQQSEQVGMLLNVGGFSKR